MVIDLFNLRFSSKPPALPCFDGRADLFEASFPRFDPDFHRNEAIFLQNEAISLEMGGARIKKVRRWCSSKELYLFVCQIKDPERAPGLSSHYTSFFTVRPGKRELKSS